MGECEKGPTQVCFSALRWRMNEMSVRVTQVRIRSSNRIRGMVPGLCFHFASRAVRMDLITFQKLEQTKFVTPLSGFSIKKSPRSVLPPKTGMLRSIMDRICEPYFTIWKPFRLFYAFRTHVSRCPPQERRWHGTCSLRTALFRQTLDNTTESR